MIKLTKELFDNIQAKYDTIFSKGGANFLADFYDELLSDVSLGILTISVLSIVKKSKINREQSCMMGLLMMYIIMESILEDRFNNFVQPSLN
jgi:hypothetical protein